MFLRRPLASSRSMFLGPDFNRLYLVCALRPVVSWQYSCTQVRFSINAPEAMDIWRLEGSMTSFVTIH